jgi:hypothetical protein
VSRVQLNAFLNDISPFRKELISLSRALPHLNLLNNPRDLTISIPVFVRNRSSSRLLLQSVSLPLSLIFTPRGPRPLYSSISTVVIRLFVLDSPKVGSNQCGGKLLQQRQVQQVRLIPIPSNSCQLGQTNGGIERERLTISQPSKMKVKVAASHTAGD